MQQDLETQSFGIELASQIVLKHYCKLTTGKQETSVQAENDTGLFLLHGIVFLDLTQHNTKRVHAAVENEANELVKIA